MATVLLLAAAGAGAQELDGVVLGPDGAPLTDATVVLHTVGAGGGAMAGTDTTGTAGEFQFSLSDDASAVYFAAIRYQGQLYVGPTVTGGSTVTDYVLEVGPSTEVGAVGAALSSPQPAQRPAPPVGGAGNSDSGALWLVAILALAAAAVFMYTAPRYRRRRTREAVMEVAGIENRLAEGGEELTDADRDRLQARRDRLKEQLAPSD